MHHDAHCLIGSLLAIVLIKPACAVSEAACIWLTIPPSTRAVGMGNTHSPLSNDPFNAWLAPGSEAIVPEGSPPLDLSLTRYAGYVDWLPGFNLNDTYLSNQALTLRMRLARSPRELTAGSPPWQLALSYQHILLNEGDVTRTDEYGNVLGVITSTESSHSLRVGLGRSHGRWALGLGFGMDNVISDLSGFMIDGQDGVGRSLTFDAGVNVQADPFPPIAIREGDAGAGFLAWTLGLQYSKLFLGPEISYSETAQGDPMPFHDRMGLASRWRLALPSSGDLPEVSLLELHMAMERSILLVGSNRHWIVNGAQDGTPDGFPENEGDPLDTYHFDSHLRVLDSRLFRGSSDDVWRSTGWELGVLDYLTLRGGHYLNRAGHVEERNRGWGLRSDGPVNLLLRQYPGMGTRKWGALLMRLQFRYDEAEISSGSPTGGTRYREFSLRWIF